MKRTITAVVLTSGLTCLGAAPASARPISQPASCQGYLAAYANPNYAFIVHELVQPLAEQLGVTVGELLSTLAKQHKGSLEACIPE